MTRKLIPDSLYHYLFHKGQSARLVLDEKGNILLGNDPFLKISRWTQQELGKMNFKDLMPSWEKSEELPEQGVIQLEADPENKYYFCCKVLDTVRKRYYTVHLQSMDSVGEDLIQKMEEDSQEQEKHTRAKSAFLANISHEIRTPMNGIMGMTDLVLQTNLTEEQREYLDIIKLSSESLLRIINDILDFSKMDSGKMTLEEISFNPHNLISELCHFFKPQMDKRKLKLHCEVAKEIPKQLWGDPLRLKQILMNLLSNAMKFTHQGGIEVRVSGQKNYRGFWDVDFAVIDSGIGIPKDKQDLLFQSFSQVDVSTSRIYGGTGLGLAISSSLAIQMGGHMSMNSQEGSGSTFRLSVPFKPAISLQKGKKKFSGESEEEILEGTRVLVVEDNRVNRLLVCRLLEKKDFHIIEAEDGQEALRYYRQEKPQIVLMDIHMPKWDGYRTLKEIRKYEEEHFLNPVPVLALTAMAMKGDQEEILNSGFQDYISKPFQPEDLFGKISRCLSPAVDKELA